jgi:hypothetical protein
MNDNDYVADRAAARNDAPDVTSAVRDGEGGIPLAAVPIKAPPANAIAVWPKAHPLIAETRDGVSHALVDLNAFNENDIERIELGEVEPPPPHWIIPAIKVAAAVADMKAEFEASQERKLVWWGGNVRRVRYRGPPRGRRAARPDDPDRPLLRLLNRASGEPVLVMCARPGNRDPAHAAAGRLPVRFHKYSDLRLLWREFPGGYCRIPTSTSELQHFAAAIVMTNAGETVIAISIETLMEAVVAAGGSVLWGEAAPDGSVVWHENFAIDPVFDGGLLRVDIRALVVAEA